MGRRYGAILRSLGHHVLGEDVGQRHGAAAESDAIIIATPTDTHAMVLRSCMKLGKPILCEKPICKDMAELRLLMQECGAAGTRLQMVSQYDHLVTDGSEGESAWDYFKSGNDGLAWDCIQIIGLAKQRPRLANSSPVWTCVINGVPLDIAAMDYAYIAMISNWLSAPRDDRERIITSHEAVIAWEAGCAS